MVDISTILYKKIGEKLTELRNLDKLTQDSLSQKIGINRATVSNIEAGRQQISLHLLYKIAQALHTEVFTFLPSLDELSVLLAKEDDQLNKELDNKNAGDILRNTIFETLKSPKNDT